MIAALTIAAAAAPARAEERYWAMFRNGAIATADELTDGDSWDDETKLGGHRLFGTANPVCIFRDNSLRPSPPGPHVLMANGDVVPGRVQQFLAAAPELNLPPRLLLSSHPGLKSADPEGLTVRADRVLCVVATDVQPSRCDPGTLVFADGRTVTASALRWTEHGLSALTADGIVSAPFDELAEIHVPHVDVIAAVLDDGVYPPLDGESLVGRLETVDGAVLSYRRAMTRVAIQRPTERPTGRSKTPPPRLLHLQPSWAPGAVLVPVDSICRRTYRATSDVPLSLMPAVLLKQEHGIHHWPWRRNRNVEGGTLRSGPIAAGLGLGTHSHSEIAFDLPPGANEFTTLVGLDEMVGEGGCARVKIYRDRVAGNPVFSSELLLGSDAPICAGPLNVSKAKRLVLVTEFAHKDRPPGADPFDIGDHVDWLMPMITLDQEESNRAELLRRFVPGWQTWTLEDDACDRVSVSVQWDEALSRWLPLVGVEDPAGLTLSRTVSSISHANDLVELNLSPAHLVTGRQIELRVDGTLIEPVFKEPITDERVKERIRKASSRSAWYGPPLDDGLILRWDLQAYRGREIRLALSLAPGENSDGLGWRGCALTSAIRNLPPEGRPFAPDVLLTALKPTDSYSPRQNAYPTPNGLWKSKTAFLPIRFLGQRYENGYAMVRDSRISFAVEPSYQRFVAVAGCCEDSVGPLSVWLDDQQAWTSGEMDESAQAIQLSVDIPPGTKKLTLRTGGDGSYAGYCGWANAGFVTR